MVKRGHEVDLEYSKKIILDKLNSYLGYNAVEKLKFISFDGEEPQKKEKINKNQMELFEPTTEEDVLDKLGVVKTTQQTTTESNRPSTTTQTQTGPPPGVTTGGAGGGGY